MYSRKLDYLYHQLELAEQDLLDHDGSELNAEARIDLIKKQIREIEADLNPLLEKQENE